LFLLFVFSLFTYIVQRHFVLRQSAVQNFHFRSLCNVILQLYYERHAFGNATTAQWVAAMEEVSGLKLQAMAGGWLRYVLQRRVSRLFCVAPERVHKSQLSFLFAM
jgi:hypothetical protein